MCIGKGALEKHLCWIVGACFASNTDRKGCVFLSTLYIMYVLSFDYEFVGGACTCWIVRYWNWYQPTKLTLVYQRSLIIVHIQVHQICDGRIVLRLCILFNMSLCEFSVENFTLSSFGVCSFTLILWSGQFLLELP